MKNHRLFFALWPDAGTRKKIKEHRNQLSLKPRCRPVPVSNLHITLHFLGNVPEPAIDCFSQQAANVEAKPFRFQLNTLGSFHRAKVFWMGLQQTPAPLQSLQQALGLQLGDCGFTCAQRYVPHVTLARHCVVPKPALERMSERSFSIDWHVDRFVLVESVTDQAGAQYQVIESYDLKS